MTDSPPYPQVFRTRLTELLGIRHPILCGGLMWLATGRYVAAVVNAGGMGFITPRSFPDVAAFREDLRACRRLTGGRPFGVNLYISARPEENARLDAYVDTFLEEGVRIVETSGRSPDAYLPRLREAGCIIVHKVSAVRHALAAQRLGVDAVTVVGMECGGHPGLSMVGTMVQGALAAGELSVPVAIGGGIGSGRQLLAALALGADGILMGSRMTVAAEIWAHEAYKRRVVEMRETDSRLVLASFRNTYRAIDNATARAVAALEAEGVRDFDSYRPHVRGTLQREAYETGDWERGILSMGQAAAFADRIQPVAGIFAEILDEARAMHARLNGLSVPLESSGRTAG